MNSPNQAFIFLVNMVAGWLNRRQQKVIDYVMGENRVLRGQLKGKRLRLTDDQRRRLAAKGKIPGRKLLDQVARLVTPDTILALCGAPHKQSSGSGVTIVAIFCNAFRPKAFAFTARRRR